MGQIEEERKNLETATLNDKVLVIDGMNTFIRNFSVNPATNDNGLHVGGMVGFLKSLAFTVKTLSPTRVIIAFDGKGGSVRRKKLFPEYKEKRKMSKMNRTDSFSTPADEKESMMEQLKRLIDYLDYLPVSVMAIENIEADDAMAYVSKQILTDSKIILMSTDKDFLQLVDDRISVWSPTKKILYTPEKIMNEYGIPSRNFVVYRAMEGDTSDCIPGIGGIKIKTVIKRFPIVLNEEKTVSTEDIKEYAENQEKQLVAYKNVINNYETFERNYKLMQLHEVDISGRAKSQILEIVRKGISSLNKLGFAQLYLKDQLGNLIPNTENWLNQSFLMLDKYVREYDGTKT